MGGALSCERKLNSRLSFDVFLVYIINVSDSVYVQFSVSLCFTHVLNSSVQCLF